MKRIARLFLGLIFLSFPFVTLNAGSKPAQRVASDQSEAEKVARELLEMTGSGKLGVHVVQPLIASFKQAMPNVPAFFWDELKNEINPGALETLIVPIYTKHFTMEEMKAIIAFYKTPVGAKLIEKLPTITQESMAVGQQWGYQLSQKIMKKLEEKGYKK